MQQSIHTSVQSIMDDYQFIIYTSWDVRKLSWFGASRACAGPIVQPRILYFKRFQGQQCARLGSCREENPVEMVCFVLGHSCCQPLQSHTHSITIFIKPRYDHDSRSFDPSAHPWHRQTAFPKVRCLLFWKMKFWVYPMGKWKLLCIRIAWIETINACN